MQHEKSIIALKNSYFFFLLELSVCFNSFIVINAKIKLVK